MGRSLSGSSKYDIYWLVMSITMKCILYVTMVSLVVILDDKKRTTICLVEQGVRNRNAALSGFAYSSQCTKRAIQRGISIDLSFCRLASRC